MVGRSEKSPREIVKTLLSHQIKPLYSSGIGGFDPGSTIADALKSEGLEEVLFGILANTREERAELYGLSNEDINLRFKNLQGDLLRLSHGGSINPSAIEEDKMTLTDLIRGVAEIEVRSRSEVNPVEASRMALFTRFLRCISDDSPISPNEIDQVQSEALELYQSCRCSRLALETILDAVVQIERAMLDGPDRPSSRRSR